MDHDRTRRSAPADSSRRSAMIGSTIAFAAIAAGVTQSRSASAQNRGAGPAPASSSPGPQAAARGTVQRSGNTILITGGGSGIGRGLAHAFHALGNTVIVAGRRLHALQETIAGRPNMHGVQLDVDDPAMIQAVTTRIVAQHPGLNAVFNVAGIMRLGEDLSRSGDLRDSGAQFTTNFLGPVRLNNALIDHIKTRPNPVIITVTSGLAFVPRAEVASYCASKAALHNYTLCLREQLRDVVKVIELIPPAVQTELVPGQSTRASAMPLPAFIDETMALLLQQPAPDENIVERARSSRFAEREGRFDQALARMNGRS